MNMQLLTLGDLSRIESVADKFKTLGHPNKFRIFKYLCDCGCKKMRVKDIYTTLGIQQATASRHLNGLKNKGLLKRTLVDGKVFFEPNMENEVVSCMSHCITEIK